MITTINQFKIIKENNFSNYEQLAQKFNSILDSPLWNTIITQLNNDDVEYEKWHDNDIILYYAKNYDSEILENKINEDQEPLNSDKEIKLKAYQNTVNMYNANKEKFKNIFNMPEEKHEDEASKIIGDNQYLGMAWKLAKIEKIIKEDEEKIRVGELSEDEKKELQENITENQKKLSETQTELNTKINTDLGIIKQM